MRKDLRDITKFTKTRYKKFAVGILMPIKGSMTIDKLTGNYSQTTQDKPFVLIDTAGQTSPLSFSDIVNNFVTKSGNMVTRPYLQSQMKVENINGEQVRYMPVVKFYFKVPDQIFWVRQIPKDQAFYLDLQSGPRRINDESRKHGDGDWLIVPDCDGEPDWDYFDVINGVRFPDMFDIRPLKNKVQ